MRTRANATLIIAAVCLLATCGPLVADDRTTEGAGTLAEQVRELYDIYWDGFGAESTGLLYHHRINGPEGIGALTTPEEIAACTVRGKEMRWGYSSSVQDVALENGELLFALCDAYDATGEAWIAAVARRAWRGLKTIGSVSPVAGLRRRGHALERLRHRPLAAAGLGRALDRRSDRGGAGALRPVAADSRDRA